MKRYAVALTLALFLASAVMVWAQSQEELKTRQNSLQRSLSKVKEKRSELQTKLRQAEAKTNQMMREIHDIDAKTTRLINNIDKNQGELEDAKKQQEELGAELRSVTVKLDEVRSQVRRRLRAIYVQGETSNLSFFAGTDSFGDLAERQALVERVAEKDRELFEQVRVLRNVVLEKKKEQDLVVGRIAELLETQRKEKEELEAARAQKKEIYSVLKATEDQLESEFKEMQRQSRIIEQQIFQIQARSSGTAIFKGKFIQPVQGRRSSGFGMRVHPISRTRRMHNGVDWAAPSGTPIVAAGDGKVISASYINGYGNTVIIDHGGNVSTLYAHCSRIHVKVGQTVKQGQRIAAVGSTGYSTGPHLHFEVRVNGKPVNPLSRL